MVARDLIIESGEALSVYAKNDRIILNEEEIILRTHNGAIVKVIQNNPVLTNTIVVYFAFEGLRVFTISVFLRYTLSYATCCAG